MLNAQMPNDKCHECQMINAMNAMNARNARATAHIIEKRNE
jgi:hypothetical protein